VGTIRRFLRSPRTITGEVIGLALAGAALASVPQATSPLAAVRFRQDHPLLAPIVQTIGLDRVLHAPAVIALLAVSAASLVLVEWELVGRLRRRWTTSPSEGSFANAPYSVELERAAAAPAPRTIIRTRGAAGHLGSPLFHAGLLCLLGAGLVRAVFGADASLQVYEGEEIPAGPEAMSARSTGFLAAPLELPVPLRLDRAEVKLHPNGAIADLAATVSVGPEHRQEHLAINAPLVLGDSQLYLTMQTGPTALLEIESQGASERMAVFLTGSRLGFERVLVARDGTEVRLRTARLLPTGALPPSVEVRLLRGTGLLYVGVLRPGEYGPMSDGGRVVLHDVRRWMDLSASRDPSAGLAFLAFAVVVVGAVLLFAVVPVETLVQTTPVPGGERVRVAMRPHRVAPLYAETFERLVERVRNGELP
jgi:cytochrome c biogenesis protein ResB